jgi:hypothetical protein
MPHEAQRRAFEEWLSLARKMTPVAKYRKCSPGLRPLPVDRVACGRSVPSGPAATILIYVVAASGAAFAIAAQISRQRLGLDVDGTRRRACSSCRDTALQAMTRA